MRSIVSTAALLLVLGCKTDNGAFQLDEDGDGGSTTTTATTEPTTSVDATGVADGSGGETEEVVDVPCEADLYGVNELGDLFLIDADSGQIEMILTGNQFVESWAMATHPSEGTVYISPINNPMVLRTLDPLTLDLVDGSIALGGDATGAIARADFDPDDMLWLGTDMTGRFLPFDTITETLGVGVMFGSGNGGDMVYLDAGLALVVDNAGLAHLVDFDAPVVIPAVFNGIPGTITGLAYDDADRLWASTFEGKLLLVEEIWEGATPEFDVIETIELGIDINDLSPVVDLPDGC